MKTNFDQSLASVLKHEGGFVNHPKDPGGATNKGITIATFRSYVKRNGTVNDLRRITDAQVAKVYKKQYWDKVKGDDLPSGVDYAVVDFAVNSGPSRSAKFLQRAVGAKADGMIGPATLNAVNTKEPVVLVATLCDARLAWLEGLRTFKTFGRGWTRRVDDVKHTATRMAASTPREADKPAAEDTGLGSAYNLLRAIFDMLKQFFK